MMTFSVGGVVRIFRSSFALGVAIVLSALPIPSYAQLYVSISAPPLLPSYVQPPVSTPNEIWTPGYWAWGSAGYYWVPGTWVQAPSSGLLYTPGYWSAAQNGYMWNQGYWAPNVGYYGGVNYGSGYYGNGYTGGGWYGNAFRYNTAVTNVNRTVIRNVYVNRTVVVRNVNRVSYYGGTGGLRVRPTPAQLAVARERHVPLTTVQRQHVIEASADRNLYANVNRGKPPVVAVARPLSTTNRPADFKPLTATDRQASQAKPAAKPVAQQAAKPAQPVTKPAQPVAKSVQPAKPAPSSAHPAAKPPAHPAAKPAAHPAAKPSAHPAAKPPAHPAAKPPAQPEKPAGKPPK
jgi:hypothetical protein